MARRVKPFVPKPFESGFRITWTQYHLDGTQTERTGTVLDRAPSVSGAQIVAWVMPDATLETDLYWAIAVGKANSRYQPVHGMAAMDTCNSRSYARKGETYASDDQGSPTGALIAYLRKPVAIAA